MAKKDTPLRKIAKEAAKGGSDVAAIIGATVTVVEAAITLLDAAKPLIEQVDTDAAAQKVKDSTHTAVDRVAKAGGAAKDAGKDAAGRFGAVLAKMGGTKDTALQAIKSHKDEAELRKLIKSAKQAVLESANATMTVDEFLEKAGTEHAVGFLDAPGAYAIATYKKLDFDKDLTDYLGVFVGKADSLGEAVLTAISRDGNPDVYADVKYKQNVKIFIYNCGETKVDERFSALFAALEAGASYNQ